MITIDNYEGYLMRYADGELDDEERLGVEAFLDKHQELRDELEAITDPALKITPPLVTMPCKEALMQPVAVTSSSGKSSEDCCSSRLIPRIVLGGIAAALALLFAFGIVLRMNQHPDNPVIAQNNGIHPITVTDSPLPDSLYIGRGKPAPLNLAKEIPSPVDNSLLAENTADNNLPELKDNKGDESHTIIQGEEEDGCQLPFENTVTPEADEPETLLAQNNATDDKVSHRRYGNVIVVETDQLVTLNPKPANRNDIRVGSVIENNKLALAEDKNIVGKALDAVARFIMRRNDNEIETSLAFSE